MIVPLIIIGCILIIFYLLCRSAPYSTNKDYINYWDYELERSKDNFELKKEKLEKRDPVEAYGIREDKIDKSYNSRWYLLFGPKETIRFCYKKNGNIFRKTITK